MPPKPATKPGGASAEPAAGSGSGAPTAQSDRRTSGYRADAVETAATPRAPRATPIPPAPAAPPRPAEAPVAGAPWAPASAVAPPPAVAPARSASSPPPAGPLPPSPDPALSWSAARHVVSYPEAEAYDERVPARPLGAWLGPRTAAAAACVVLGFGLIGGAVTGSWLTGDSGSPGPDNSFTAAAGLWHSVPVDELFPLTVEGTGAGPGGADRTWTRIAVAPDSGCANAFDPLLRKALAPVGCQRLLRATYTDATQSYVTTVGLLFTKADSAAMSSLATRFDKEGLDRRTDLMPRPYAAKGTAAAAFGDKQRASWTISVLTDAPVVAYAVSGWADGRTVDAPQPAADAMQSGATTAPAQAGVGQEAQGLADRIQRSLRKTVSTATETPS
ncbi:hypothetical protein ACIPSA_21540 [Streptomyces sp. NPDC086549]|uniref:hypothetical protein n=1 Tax=Streptomyces sp. NPDC086549 TaxID=3365752 RepID=UPI00380F3533